MSCFKPVNSRLFLFLLLLLLVIESIYPAGSKVFELKDVFKPRTLAVDDKNLYVGEMTSFYIFSLKDFSLVKKAGRAGEGPGEFKLIWGIFPSKNQLTIDGVLTVYNFSKTGEYIGEKRINNPSYIGFKPLGGNYVGNGFTQEKKISYNTIDLLDSKFKKIKEFARYESIMQVSRKKIKLLEGTPGYYTTGDKLILSDGDRTIGIYDSSGKKLQSITLNIEKIKVPGDYEKKFKESLKSNKKLNSFLDMFKDNYDIPSYFKGIRFIEVDDSKIYVITYKKINKGYECILLDLNGKLLRRTVVPLSLDYITDSGMFTIYHDKIYQVIENEDKEIYEVHITPF